jgi:Domain of unknown function (DUF1707)
MPEPHLRAPEPHLRASDSDRTAVATALGEHMAAGRLTLAEYEERLTHVYETKTLGGLATLTADLPSLDVPRTPAPAAAARVPARAAACGAWREPRNSAWSSWLRTALIVVGIWLVTSVATSTLLFFWPIWVIGPWGVVLLARTVTGGRTRHRGPGRLSP